MEKKTSQKGGNIARVKKAIDISVTSLTASKNFGIVNMIDSFIIQSEKTKRYTCKPSYIVTTADIFNEMKPTKPAAIITFY